MRAFILRAAVQTIASFYFQEEQKLDLAVMFSFEVFFSRTVSIEDAAKAEGDCGTPADMAKAILKSIEVQFKNPIANFICNKIIAEAVT
jgi:hypothetical protein